MHLIYVFNQAISFTGIIPTACEHLFKVIENKKANDDERLQNEYQVFLLFLLNTFNTLYYVYWLGFYFNVGNI